MLWLTLCVRLLFIRPSPFVALARPSHLLMSASRTIARLAATRLVARPGCHSRVRYAARTPSLPHYPVVLVASVPCAGLATNSNPTSTVSHRPDALDPRRLLSRRPSAALTPIESKGSVLDLYRKICRLLPQVLKGYELQGEDSYHRALRNLRFYFEHHAALQDPNVVEVLRHKAEMEIEEAMLMSAAAQPHALPATASTAASSLSPH